MQITQLELVNFRNYEALTLELEPGANVFCGRNAQGKTNLLEAVFLMSCARSHRTGRDQELIRNGEKFYQVSLDYVYDNGAKNQLSIRYEGNRRQITENGLPLERVADLFGKFHAVIFAPEDLQLVKDGPSVRRRYMDLLISAISPSYFRDLQLYQRILKQRNELLKRARDERETWRNDPLARRMKILELEIWNEQMAACGARIIKKRQEFCEKIEASAGEAVKTLSGERETLALRYRCPSGVEASSPLPEVEKAYLERIRRYMEDDMFRGSSSQGPHRDDLEFLLNDLDARVYGSQGQQRSIVLALKLAELSIIEEECGERPVLLLDDVMSELDEKRRKRLAEALRSHQVLISATEYEKLWDLEDLPALFKVDNAVVTRTNPAL